MVEDALEVVFFGCQVLVIFLQFVDQALGDDLALPGLEVDGLTQMGGTWVLSETWRL